MSTVWTSYINCDNAQLGIETLLKQCLSFDSISGEVAINVRVIGDSGGAAAEPPIIATAGQQVFDVVISMPTDESQLVMIIEGVPVLASTYGATITGANQLTTPAFTGGETIILIALDNN